MILTINSALNAASLCIISYLNLTSDSYFQAFGSGARQTDAVKKKKKNWTETQMHQYPTCFKMQSSPINLPRSIAQELPAAVRPVLLLRAFPRREEVGAEQPVEINEDHDVHHHQGDQEVPAVVQPGVVVEDVPGEVELCAEAEQDVGQEVGVFVDVVEGGGLGARQLQHQTQVQGDAVDLHEERDDGAGDVQLSVQAIQEAPDHLESTETQTGGPETLVSDQSFIAGGRGWGGWGWKSSLSCRRNASKEPIGACQTFYI